MKITTRKPEPVDQEVVIVLNRDEANDLFSELSEYTDTTTTLNEALRGFLGY